nr:putative CYP719 [synthetic construct]
MDVHYSTLLIALATLASLLLLSKLLLRSINTSKHHQWPPGPNKLPLIGNLHQFRGDLLHQNFAELAQKYGKLMTVWIGSQQPFIVVTDPDLAWEVLVTRAVDYWSRQMLYLSRIISAGNRTLATSDGGPYWETLRRGLQSTALSPQTISSQTKLQEQDIAHMIASLQQEASLNDGLVKPLPHIRKLAIRLLARLCFGADFPNDEHFVERMDELLEDDMRLLTAAGLVDVFEFTRHIPGLTPRLKEIEDHMEGIKGLIRPCLAAAMKKKGNSISLGNTHMNFLISQGFTEEIIILNLFEVFVFGVDSTSISLSWALGFLIDGRETQEKVLKEIVSKLGGSRRVVGVGDVSGMEYVHAVVKETLRMRPVAPMAVPHKAARDSELMGFKVKEGTPFFVNLYALHHNEKAWKDANKFVAERFVKGDGAEEYLKKMERYYIPFGAGRRACPGMELAKVHLAMVVANLVNSFEWQSAVEGQPLDLSETLNPLLVMKTPLVARLVPRFA